MLSTIKDKTRDRIKCSLFTVEGCSSKTNLVISPTVKYTEKMEPGKGVHYEGVFTNQGCSLPDVSLHAFPNITSVPKSVNDMACCIASFRHYTVY